MGREKGYYWVKFYNYPNRKMSFWNGNRFECYPSDFPDDEIEAIDESRIIDDQPHTRD